MSQSKAALSAMPWDITVLRIVHKIDGKISIHRIAEEADVRQILKCLLVFSSHSCNHFFAFLYLSVFFV